MQTAYNVITGLLLILPIIAFVTVLFKARADAKMHLQDAADADH